MYKVLPVLLLSLCCSCSALKPKYITQIQHDTTTVYQNNTIYQLDSVYVFKDRYVYTKGDTVYNNTVEYRDRWKVKEIHDTVNREHVVFVDKEVPVEIEKKLTKSQKLFINFGKVFSILLLIGLGYGVFKAINKIKVL